MRACILDEHWNADSVRTTRTVTETYALGLFPIDIRKQAMIIEARKYFKMTVHQNVTRWKENTSYLNYCIEILDIRQPERLILQG